MERDALKKVIALTQASSEPLVEFLSRATRTGSRVGIFASSFNPITNAHVELMQRAASGFNLDETLALAGLANADKEAYECPLEDRLAMILSTFEHDPSTSIGLSSHAYCVDPRVRHIRASAGP
jgi:phosphopantetheine adenylyltransferase